MMTNSAVYFALAFVVFTAVLGGTIAHRLHRPLIIGYALGGILIGFLLPRFPIIDVHTLELFAEIEATLLMYWAGVEFSFRALLEVKWIAILGTSRHVALDCAGFTCWAFARLERGAGSSRRGSHVVVQHNRPFSFDDKPGRTAIRARPGHARHNFGSRTGVVVLALLLPFITFRSGHEWRGRPWFPG